MGKSTIFMDLDDTVKDTERYIRRVMQCNGVKPPTVGSVYLLIDSENDSLVKESLCNYDVIPFKQGARNAINLLSTEYEIVFCSGCRYEEEKEGKKKLAEELGKELILCSGDQWDKSHVDMRGSIFVDDRSDILIRSNADKKFEMFNPYYFCLTSERDDRTSIVDWFSLVDILMGAQVNEELRRTFCQGIQGIH